MSRKSDRVLGVIPEPGHYEFRARKGAPRQPLRIIHTLEGAWVVLLNGVAVAGSGAADWVDVPLLLRWPFHPISHDEYLTLFAASEEMVRDPDEAVDLRNEKSLY